MKNKLYPCLWFDGNGKAAAEFYCALFPGSKITTDNGLVQQIELCGQKIMLLNGGPMFKPDPSLSLFVTCETNGEIDALWEKLSQGAKILMPPGKYDWSEYYGFLQDKFGFAWQLFKGPFRDVGQKITPCFLFTDARFGQANEAVKTYSTVFKKASVDGVLFYPEEAMPGENIVMHAQFRLEDFVLMAMDGAGEHGYAFSEAFSIVVECSDQAEIDYYWEKLTEGGQESMCGWLKDRFGVSWQIVPDNIGSLMMNPERGKRVMDALLKMRKLDIASLMNA